MKQAKKQETDNKTKDESLKWWVNLGHEYAAKLRDKYFPDRTLLTADERLKIYLSETKANDKPGGSDTALTPADITPDFNYQRIDPEDNLPDLEKWVKEDKMVALIDEEMGGIIGYIHQDHIDRITAILNTSKG